LLSALHEHTKLLSEQFERSVRRTCVVLEHADRVALSVQDRPQLHRSLDVFSEMLDHPFLGDCRALNGPLRSLGLGTFAGCQNLLDTLRNASLSLQCGGMSPVGVVSRGAIGVACAFACRELLREPLVAWI